MTTTRLEEDHCPECGKILDAASSIDGQDVGPQPDDIGMCFECTSYLVYDGNLKVRLMTADEIVELPHDVLMQLAKERVRILAFHKWQELQNG